MITKSDYNIFIWINRKKILVVIPIIYILVYLAEIIEKNLYADIVYGVISLLSSYTIIDLIFLFHSRKLYYAKIQDK
ncbi:MAG: hypothetical protein ACYDAO_03690 [Thermoplasmataceae archaeon]